jgi:L-lysine 2,3-aminomutase
VAAEKPHHQRAQLEQYMTLTAEEKAGCAFADKKLSLAITPYFFNLIDRNDPDCPIRKQVIPREGEMQLSSRRCSIPLARTNIRPCRAWCTVIRTGCSSS